MVSQQSHHYQEYLCVAKNSSLLCTSQTLTGAVRLDIALQSDAGLSVNDKRFPDHGGSWSGAEVFFVAVIQLPLMTYICIRVTLIFLTSSNRGSEFRPVRTKFNGGRKQ